MNEDTVEVHEHAKKIEAIVTKQAWSIKDLFSGIWHKQHDFSCETKWAIPNGKHSLLDSPIVPASVANHSAGFGSSHLLEEPRAATCFIFQKLGRLSSGNRAHGTEENGVEF